MQNLCKATQEGIFGISFSERWRVSQVIARLSWHWPFFVGIRIQSVLVSFGLQTKLDLIWPCTWEKDGNHPEVLDK